jgi:hypothetical protein
MAYQVRLLDRAEREAHIERRVDASHDFEEFHELRGEKTRLKVIRVPIDLLIYRMENFRAFSDQAEYMAREHKPEDYFRAGQENESVQQVQHEILAKLAAKGKAKSVVPVIDVLEREGQRDTLLITHRGVVVNGNRRLAGMRELFNRDAGAYPQFSHVNCKVLPADTTASDLLEIEAILQARPETRLDYDWIGDAQLLSAMLKMKGTPDAVAQILGRKVSEVKNVLQALSEADMYLKEWAQAEGEYNRVAEDGEQLFKDLPGQVQGKPSALQDASRVIAWALFEGRRKLEGRLYNYNVTFGKRAEDVLERMADELGVSLTTDGGENAGDYDFDMGESSGEVSYQPLIDVLRDDVRKSDAFDTLVEICVSVVESEKDKKSGNAALKAISAANSKLAEVDLSRASRDTYETIERQLLSIIQRANDLRTKMTGIRAEPPGTD